jgi:hypothetical protein
MSAVQNLQKITYDGIERYLSAFDPRSFTDGSSTWKDIMPFKRNVSLFNHTLSTDTGTEAIAFNGSNTYASFSTPNLQLYSPNRWSVDGWLYPIGPSSGYIVSTSANGSDQSIYWSGGVIVFQVCSSTDTNVRYRTTNANTAPANKWTHFAASLNDLTIKLYINGVLNKTFVETISIAGWGGTWRLGMRTIGTVPLNGQMSQFRLYNKILTDSEVFSNYAAHRAKHGRINI